MFETVRVEAATVGAASRDVCNSGTNAIIICMPSCKSLTGM